MWKRIKAVLASAVALVGLTAVNVSAALDFTPTGMDLAMNVADVEIVMALVIPALAILWGFRKIIKTMNRS